MLRNPARKAPVVLVLAGLFTMGAACNGDKRASSPSTSTSTPESPIASPTASVSPTADSAVSSEARVLIVDLGGRNGPDGIIFELSSDILFDSGSSTLKPEAQETIDKLAKLTRLIRRDRIKVTGHTDSVGDEASNQKLSVERAQAVADAIQVTNADVRGRIIVRGSGEREPIADNSTEEGRAKNRRVEIEFQGVRF